MESRLADCHRCNKVWALSEDFAISPSPQREAPWAAGLRAARANVAPGLIVQGLMLTILLAYYFYSPTRGFLDQLALLKSHLGYGYSGLNAVVAGAVIPEVLRVLVFQRRKILRQNFLNLLFTVPFWLCMGIIVDFFYRCQGAWFGESATFWEVVKKVFVDQFIYNPLFAAPVTTWLYDWKSRGYRWQEMTSPLSVAYYRDFIVPTLFATWGVWIPVVTILYSLPSLLQIPLFGLALSLWVMLYTWMSEQRTAHR